MSPCRPIALPPRLGVDFLLSSIPRPFPDDALRSELAIELWIDAFTAVIDVQTFAALLTESRFMLVADPNGLPVWMVSALHRFFAPTLFFSPFATGRGWSST
jgi:hypothetical protein